MAEWYYSKNGQTFGPFTGEAMDGLIASGEVTFVTLVWSEETGRSGQGWVYAYETNLTEYFSEGLTPPSLPPVNQATAPEAPVVLPKAPPPAEPEKAPPSDEQDLNVSRPKKTPRAPAVFLALFAAGLLLGTAAAGYIFYVSLSFDDNSASVTERALPSVNGGNSIVLKVTDTKALRSLALGAESAISSLGSEITDEGPLNANILSRVKSSMEGFNDLLAAMDEMSLLVVPSDDPAVYASFTERGGALDIFMSRPQTFFSARVWDKNSDDGMTGWTISVPFLENPLLYVMERPYGKGSVVFAARTEEGAEAMLSASRDKNRRFIPKRATSGKDFIQINFPGGLTGEAMKEALAPLAALTAFGRTRRIQTARGDKALWTTSEASWTKEGNVLEFEAYGDFPAKNPELAANMPKITRETNFLGAGELTCFIAADAGFMMECIFPGSADPAGEAPKAFVGGLFNSAAVLESFKAALKNARLSVVCTEDGRSQTAYLLIESDAEESLEKFHQTYAPLAVMFGGEPLKLDGWNSAMSVRVPFYGGSNANIVLARRRGALLLGIGEPANFSKSIPVKSEYKDYISPENFANIIVSPKFYDALLEFTDSYYAVPAGSDDVRQKTKNGLIALRNSFQLFCGNVKTSGHSNGRLVMTNGSDPAGAAFKLLSQIALTVPAQR